MLKEEKYDLVVCGEKSWSSGELDSQGDGAGSSCSSSDWGVSLVCIFHNVEMVDPSQVPSHVGEPAKSIEIGSADEPFCH